MKHQQVDVKDKERVTKNFPDPDRNINRRKTRKCRIQKVQKGKKINSQPALRVCQYALPIGKNR